jgi:hypothetical protein
MEIPSQLDHRKCLLAASEAGVSADPAACKDPGYTLSAVRVVSRLIRLSRIAAFLQVPPTLSQRISEIDDFKFALPCLRPSNLKFSWQNLGYASFGSDLCF